MKTTNIKKVLIALDYDPTAQKVAEEGYALAQAMGAEVILLHVILDLTNYPYTYMNMDPLQLDSVAELKEASLQFLNKTKLRLGDGTIRTIVAEGGFAETILETATGLHVNIIVMGSHSKKWLEDIVMGSITKKVLQQVSIPLFIVPIKKQ